MAAFARSLSSLGLILCVCAVLPSASGVRAADADRPMGGSCATTFVFTNNQGAVHIEGICHFLHLGLTTVVAEQTVTPTGPTTLLITNTAISTAANGDELYSSFVGTGTIGPSGVTFSGTETFSGGTGRFIGASGSATVTGTATFTSPEAGIGQFRSAGAIVY